jgi:hypothetical protein
VWNGPSEEVKLGDERMTATKVKKKPKAIVKKKRMAIVEKKRKTVVKEERMAMPEIRMKAKALNLTPGKMNKADLIHAIQVAEGYTACFGQSNGYCHHTDCCFMKDCLKIKS